MSQAQQNAAAQVAAEKAGRRGSKHPPGASAASFSPTKGTGGRMGNPNDVPTLPDDIIHQHVRLFGGSRGTPQIEDVWLTATRPLHHYDDDTAAMAAMAATTGGKRRNAMVEELRSSQAGLGAGTHHDDDTLGGKRVTSPFVGKKGELTATSTFSDEISSVAPAGADVRKVKITIWPEFNEADINGEKWEIAHKVSTKEKEKGKSPLGHNLFEDPEGRPEMPPSLRPAVWKRPFDISVEKTPTVVDADYQTKFDLITPNKHIMHSEVMRFIISQINALWQIKQIRNPPPAAGETDLNWEEVVYTWRPWEHIYAINKIAKEKGPYLPAYNPFGKYVVRLFWMGCWRKLIVDDQMPFDEKDQMLLPATSNTHELWPMLLAKAILKIISLDVDGSEGNLELGDNSVIHMFTGWLPELVPLHPTIGCDIWTMLKQFLPEFKLPTINSNQTGPQSGDQQQNPDAQLLALVQESGGVGLATGAKGPTTEQRSKIETAPGKARPEKVEKQGNKADVKAKESKPSKDKDKVAKSEEALPENREVVIFAYYTSYPKGALPVAMLRKMAEESETLRKKGLSQMGTHMVWLKQCRACPLEPPPPPEVIPAWKLIRPRKPRIIPADLPNDKIGADASKPIQCLEMASPYIGTPFWTAEQERLELERHAAKLVIAEEGDEIEVQQVTVATSQPMAAPQQPPSNEASSASVTTELKKPGQTVPLPPSQQQQRGNKPPSVAPSDKRLANRPDSKPEGGNAVPPRQAQEVNHPSEFVVHDETAEYSGVFYEPGADFHHQSDVIPVNNERVSHWLKTVEVVPAEELIEAAPSAIGTASVLPGQLAAQPVDEVGSVTFGAETTMAEQMKSTWLDFEDFMACFKYVVIFHKTNTYPHVKTFTDIKGQVVTRDRRVSPSGSSQGLQSEDKAVYFLTVDSLDPIELVFCVSAICKWPELTSQQTARPRDAESVSETTSVTGGQPQLAVTAGTEPSAGGAAQPLFSGSGELLVERHSWKSLASGSTILRLHTNTIRATALLLPAGRHVLRLVVGAPLAYHLTVTSMANFALGDEDFVMQNLTKESMRYTDTAVRIVNSFITCLSLFGNRPAYMQSFTQMMRLALPSEQSVSRRRALNNFVTSLASATKAVLGDAATPDMDFAWRVIFQDPNAPSVIGTATTSRPGTSIGGAPGAGKRASANAKEKDGPAATQPQGKEGQGKEKAEHGGGKEKGSTEKGGKGKKDDGGEGGPKSKKEASSLQASTAGVSNVSTTSSTITGIPANYIFSEREPNSNEVAAIIKLQKVQRGFVARKVLKADSPGNPHFERATTVCLKMAELLQPHTTIIAANLFRMMFGDDPDLLRFYPFYDDEWNRIAYADYAGSYPEQTANSWFLLFRDVFYVKQVNLVVPRLTCSLSPAFLRVVDNDTGEEIERVFCRVAPFNYAPNKRGYTILAEARSGDSANAVAGRWRMRLIGSHATLPQPAHTELISSFCIREIRDYFVPNERNVVCRYTVKVTSLHLTTIYAAVSDVNAEICLEIFDKDRLIQHARGRGATLIPAFIFLPDSETTAEVEEPPAPAPTTTKTPVSKAASSVSTTTTRPISRGAANAARSPSPKTNRRSSRPNSRAPSPGTGEPVTHRWIVQVTLTNPRTWPLPLEFEPWFDQLRDQAKQEMKLAYDNEANHGSTSIKVEMTPRAGAAASSTAGQSTTGAPTGAKDSKTAKPAAGAAKGVPKRESKALMSRPPSVGFDEQKPHSIVKIISDYNASDEIEVYRDTSKADEVRAMKRAWEEAEPGRAVKARQSRLNYLRSRGVPVDDMLASVGGPNAPADAIDKALAKIVLPDVDFSPFLRCWKDLTPEERRVLDPQTRPYVIAEYAAAEQDALAFLETDKNIRKLLKKQLMDDYGDIQRETVSAWLKLVGEREEIRTRLLEEERRRQEAEAAALAEKLAHEQALAAEQAAANAAKGKGKGSPKAAPKKKK